MDNVITDPIMDPELIQEPMHPDAVAFLANNKFTGADLAKYSEDQARDDHGRFTSGGGGLSSSY